MTRLLRACRSGWFWWVRCSRISSPFLPRMMRPQKAAAYRFLVMVALAVLLYPGMAAAQSTISGRVSDDTGGILPGVTVEAASPVLIEQVRTAVTDGQGRYTIVDVRPGVYRLTFSLPGFSTVVRDGIELPANFTASVDVIMRVGGIEETITVSGESPIIDVQRVQRSQVLTREILDAVPTARNYSGLAALIPGVKMSNTDVAGNQQMEQVYMEVHGARRQDVTLQVDGMMMNALFGEGSIQAYHNDAMQNEITYQTSAAAADVSGGGVRINMVPREGGNIFSGSGFIGGVRGSWQGDNVTQALRDRGLQRGDTVAHIYDINLSLGGPIFQNKLWFYGSWRLFSTNEEVANNFFAAGPATYGTAPPVDLSRPGIEDQWIQNQSVRLTWQASPRNKFNVYYDKYPKFKGHEMGALTDPETAAGRREPKHAIYYMAQAKWTSTVSSRLLLEAGYSSNIENLTVISQPGIRKERGAPAWFAQTLKQDLLLGTAWNSSGIESGHYPSRFVISSSASYVTGSHALKAGVQWTFGRYKITGIANGDLYQRYLNGVPSTVVVFNTPRLNSDRLDGDVGMYVQDTWTIDRLTINGGLRLESFHGSIDPTEIGGGRFVGPRSYAGVPALPDWFDVAPRFGISYDLFGNSKTALKASVSKFMRGTTVGIPSRYNPMGLQSDVRTWTDRNRDDIAQDSEIGPSNNRQFGLITNTGRRPDPDLRREYDLEYSAGIQHEVLPGVAANVVWYRRGFHRIERSENLLIGLDDYAPVTVISPLNGEAITVYNLDRARLGLRDIIDTNSTDSELRRRSYNGFEVSLNARLPFGAAVFGGWMTERTIDVSCDGTAVIAGTTYIDDPNTFRFCDQSQLDIPFRHEFKAAGSLPLPGEIQVSVALQSYAGDPLGVNWILTRATRYAAGCPGPCQAGQPVIPNLTVSSLTVRLIPPQSKFLERLNQLDVSVRKIFRFGQTQWSGQVDVFNATNSSFVKGEIQTWGPSLGRPTSTLQPRTLRLAAQFRF